MLKPDDEGFAKAPNPALPAGWVLLVAVSSGGSVLPVPDVVEAANGLVLEPDVDEAPKVPKGEVVELASAAKPEEAKAAADVWDGFPLGSLTEDASLVLVAGRGSIDVLPNGAWETSWGKISF